MAMYTKPVKSGVLIVSMAQLGFIFWYANTYKTAHPTATLQNFHLFKLCVYKTTWVYSVLQPITDAVLTWRKTRAESLVGLLTVMMIAEKQWKPNKACSYWLQYLWPELLDVSRTLGFWSGDETPGHRGQCQRARFPLLFNEPDLNIKWSVFT